MVMAMATHGHGFDRGHGHNHGRVNLHLRLHGQRRPRRDIGEKERNKHGQRLSMERGIVTKKQLNSRTHLQRSRRWTTRGSLVVGGGPPPDEEEAAVFRAAAGASPSAPLSCESSRGWED